MKQYLISPEQIVVLKHVSEYVCKMFIELADGNRRLSKPAIVELESLDNDILAFRTSLNLPLSTRLRFEFHIEIDETVIAFKGNLLDRQAGDTCYTYGVKIDITDDARTLLYYTINELLIQSDPILSKKHNSYLGNRSLYYCRPQINFLT
ncbi:hypothetical protein ACFQI7_17970 [Paenibacillus allorhizosphaerae]|uniref:PilZ domain-containing protein n=1 Tax=Paenibacillus allorhizosphaerae TaxID=2849866 RepID=A0ABM8VEW1_9BACL|nr:hypothetical protein [Paenibacillus allorhizosphaerae]CAG7632745.1 hypothetical protein PAECIP111802_01876 [Paenibacillus allorhizosphaerae]